MGLGDRIRRIREIRGMNHKIIAEKMHITAQTYSTFEEGGNSKYSTIKKFCDAAGVDISFLLAEDVPVSESTVAFFDKFRNDPFFLCYEQLRQKVEVYSEVLKLNPAEVNVNK